MNELQTEHGYTEQQLDDVAREVLPNNSDNGPDSIWDDYQGKWIKDKYRMLAELGFLPIV